MQIQHAVSFDTPPKLDGDSIRHMVAFEPTLGSDGLHPLCLDKNLNFFLSKMEDMSMIDYVAN